MEECSEASQLAETRAEERSACRRCDWLFRLPTLRVPAHLSMYCIHTVSTLYPLCINILWTHSRQVMVLQIIQFHICADSLSFSARRNPLPCLLLSLPSLILLGLPLNPLPQQQPVLSFFLVIISYYFTTEAFVRTTICTKLLPGMSYNHCFNIVRTSPISQWHSSKLRSSLCMALPLHCSCLHPVFSSCHAGRGLQNGHRAPKWQDVPSCH